MNDKETMRELALDYYYTKSFNHNLIFGYEKDGKVNVLIFKDYNLETMRVLADNTYENDRVKIRPSAKKIAILETIANESYTLCNVTELDECEGNNKGFKLESAFIKYQGAIKVGNKTTDYTKAPDLYLNKVGYQVKYFGGNFRPCKD